MKCSIINFLLFSLVGTTSIAADELVEVENLWLTQDIHVSAEFLCQDGVNIYFKSAVECFLATNKVTCTQELKISPINYIEKVNLPDGRYVTQFFNIPTNYSLMVYELEEDGPIKNYSLVYSERETIPLCLGMSELEPKKIRGSREATGNEILLMESLLESGVSIINSPYGKVDPKMLIEQEEKYNESTIEKISFKSPLCSEKLDYDDLVVQANGEWSGNGIIAVDALYHWQDESKDLLIQKKPKANQGVPYEFFCVQDEIDV